MSALLGFFGPLISSPWVAFVIAIAFALAARVRGRIVAWVAAVAWLVYGVYETGIRRHLLCSGDCSIRVDLLLIYPLLAALSAMAAIALLWPRRVTLTPERRP